MEFTFRCARPQDAASLRAILNSAYTETWTKHGLHVAAAIQTLAQTTAQIAKGDVFVLVHADTVVGTVRVQRKQLHDGSVVAYITHLARHRDFAGHRIGERLMSSAETAARGFGATLMTLDTAEVLDGLVAFYRQLGYKSAGRFMHTQTNFWSLWLEKEVPASQRSGNDAGANENDPHPLE